VKVGLAAKENQALLEARKRIEEIEESHVTTQEAATCTKCEGWNK